MLFTLDGADVTCYLTIKFQNTCWSGPSNLFVVSRFSVVGRYSEPVFTKNNPVDLSSLNKSDQLEGPKRISIFSFPKSFMFPIYGVVHSLLKLSNILRSQKPPNIYASDSWSRFSVFCFIQYSQLCRYLWAHWLGNSSY